MLTRALKHIRDGLISLGYPEECRVCGGAIETWDDGVSCARCWSDASLTKFFSGIAVCNHCGIPVAVDTTKRPALSETPPRVATQPSYCSECVTRQYAVARACGEYSGAIEASILFLKSHPFLCPRIRSVITETLARDASILASDLVLPVPLHRKRRRQRGFNQAGLLADIAARTFALRVREDVLLRVKYTERHRAGMDAKDRARSVEKAFKVVKPNAVRGRTVLVVDDLYTTGSTVSAVVGELLSAGVARANVFTVARVAPPRTARIVDAPALAHHSVMGKAQVAR
ncbi:MAG TPA: phosphoribosyltransferase family protein [Blastocatellia bacterium]|nr:phosphoribosyltransferase family protein [Blastocatellia bacterium]